MNSGRIFTEPRSGEVNILPLFTEIEKNNCFSIYTGSDLNNIFRRKPLKIDLIDLSIHAWKTCKRYKARANSRNACIIHSVGSEKCSLARDSEPIRLLKTPRSLSVYILTAKCKVTWLLQSIISVVNEVCLNVYTLFVGKSLSAPVCYNVSS